MKDQLILDRLNSRLPDRFKAIEVVDIRKSGRNNVPYVRFLDKKTKKTFTYHGNLAVSTILKNEDHPFKPDISCVDKYQLLVNEIVPGRYLVLSATKEGTHYILSIKDLSRNVEFRYIAHKFIKKVSNDPDHIFSPTKSERVSRSKSGSIKNWGVEHPMQSPQYVSQYIQSKIDNGHIKKYSGKTISEIAAESGCSYSWAAEVLRSGNLPGPKSRTYIEDKIQKFLSELNIKFEYEPNIDGMKPDFVLPDHKLIIECDGLYWHSEFNGKQSSSHYDRLLKFESLGYRVLAFREDEIKNKWEIVSSILLNSIGDSVRIGARKLKFCEIDSKFFDENHLMGCGSKKKGIGLEISGDPLIAMSFKRVANKPGWWEIDRLCTKMGYQVPGGISRILNRFVIIENPLCIQTFVDRRYGTGKGLIDIGFVKISEAPSFRWTDCRNVFHRLAFSGNSGYSKGLTKIWDYGQAKFNLILD